MGFPGGSVVKNQPANAGDASIPGSGRSPRVGSGNSVQRFCLENSMDRGAWWATVHGVAKSRTQLSTHTHFRSQYLASSWVSCLDPEVLHSRHHSPCLCSFAALGRKFPLHSRHHSTSYGLPKEALLSLLQLRKQAHQL